MAVDPTYPLYPVLAITSAFLLLLVLTTNFVRQSWNLGVTFLCFWVFWVLLLEGIDSVIWADNADPKLFVYCDIVSHIYVIQLVATPASTLLITRRLYKIASMESLLPSGRREILLDRAFEWGVGLGLPVLVAGVFYYIDQGARFVIEEGRGCLHAINLSGYSILTIWSWGIVLPTISLLFYIPKIFLVFYRHSREKNLFLQTNSSISRHSYIRLLILGSLDILLSLPIGIIHLENEIKGLLPGFKLKFYDGWNAVHSNWGPASIPYNELVSVNGLIPAWFEIALAIVVFGLFGLTAAARVTYRRIFYAVFKPFGIKPPVRRHSDIESIKFCPRQDETSQQFESSKSVGDSIVRGETNVLDLEHGSTSIEEVSLREKLSGEQPEKIFDAGA